VAGFSNLIAGINQSEKLLSRRSVSITIDLSAIRNNVATARRLSSGAKLFATVKADAYGHGAIPVAHALSASSANQKETTETTSIAQSDYFADGFAVVTIDEALELRRSGITESLLILQGPQSADAYAEMHHNKLWPVIHDMTQYESLLKFRERHSLPAWLKVDSGMGRLGVSVEEANGILRADNDIDWIGLMTHFACADETNNDFTLKQYERFKQVIIKRGMKKSLANSAAVLSWPQVHEDWVRPGIMLYGCNPLDIQLPEGIRLQHAMTVEAPLISTKTLAAGSGIGYAQRWHCPEDMPVGLVGLGYRDGVPRVLNDTASVAINGTRCRIIGRVSMDSFAVDLRPVGLVETGSRVQIWGEASPVDVLASAADTVNYELLTSIRGCRHYNVA